MVACSVNPVTGARGVIVIGLVAEALNVKELIAEICIMLKPSAQEKGLALEIDCNTLDFLKRARIVSTGGADYGYHVTSRR